MSVPTTSSTHSTKFKTQLANRGSLPSPAGKAEHIDAEHVDAGVLDEGIEDEVELLAEDHYDGEEEDDEELTATEAPPKPKRACSAAFFSR
eukprot:5946379-Amphidinium_carterae.1